MNTIRLSSIVALLGALVLAQPAAAQLDIACSANGGTNCTGIIPDFPNSTPGSVGSGPFISSFTVPAGACTGAAPLGVGVRVNLVHNHVGDLTITAAGPAGTATLLNQPAGAFVGGCAGDDVQATFSNQGTAPNSCQEGGIPAVTGLLAPVSGGSALNTLPGGTWTLTVIDNSNGFEGFVQDWAIVAQCAPLVIPTQSPLGLIALMLATALLGAARLRAGRRRR